jgi:hypothetical protein
VKLRAGLESYKIKLSEIGRSFSPSGRELCEGATAGAVAIKEVFFLETCDRFPIKIKYLPNYQMT